MRQPPKYEVRMVSRDYGWTDREFAFLLPDRKGTSVPPDQVAPGLATLPKTPIIFILHPEARPLAAQLQARFPGGRLVDGSAAPLTGVFYAFFTE
jgi:hypothetical protein